VKTFFNFKHLPFLCAVLALSAVFSFSTAVAQNTSSAIRVVVTDANGAAAGGVRVNVTHVPTGRTQVLTSNAQGAATTRGLAVGGPYEVSVAGGGEYAADVIQNIYLELDKTAVVDLAVRSVIEEIMVTAVAPTGEVAVGVGSAFDRSKIDGTPSLSRDFISTLATDPKILVDNSVARGPALSLAGGNFRYNSVTIDGVAQNDNFGLSKNASATQRTPISIDAIEAVNVNIAPYDVSYGNFIGGNINIVTKSGTNDFEGSVYAFSTDDSLTGDESDGEDLAIQDFSEDYYGFTLGGPIVKDKLFFFVNYEKFETDRPSNTQTLSNIAGVTQTDVDLTKMKKFWSNWIGTLTMIIVPPLPTRKRMVTLSSMTSRSLRSCNPIDTTSMRNLTLTRCRYSQTGPTLSVLSSRLVTRMCRIVRSVRWIQAPPPTS
jgi:hypothetical protein